MACSQTTPRICSSDRRGGERVESNGGRVSGKDPTSPLRRRKRRAALSAPCDFVSLDQPEPQLMET
eukprot:2205020-Pleurochrysis_carterae.AAC.1